MKKIFWVAILVLLLSSCVTKLEVIQSKPKAELVPGGYIKNYTLNEEKLANTGDVMIVVQRSGGSVIKDAYKVIKQIDEFSEGEYLYEIGRTKRGIIVSTIEDYKPNYRHIKSVAGYGGKEYNWTIGIETSEEGVIIMAPINISYEDKPIEFRVLNDTTQYWKREKVLEKTTSTTKLDNSRYKYRISYGGKNGDVIKLSYSEYYDDMIRQAFNKDFEYNLSESNVITLKTIKMKITNATSSFINFVVIEDVPLSSWVN